MQKSKNVFIILSLIIAFISSIFAASHYFYSEKKFYLNLDIQQQHYYTSYSAILESTYNGLSTQTNFFSNDKQTQDLFLSGKKMLEKEGGTYGGIKTTEARNKLYQHVINPWSKGNKNIQDGLFQFHLGPGSLSFLRVHKPEKFGDRMDTLRFTVVDTNMEQTPRTGYETGRIASAIRSVVPVFSWDQKLKKKIYTGALEVGQSYKEVLKSVSYYNQVDIGIILYNEHVKRTVWDEFITDFYKQKTVMNCNCILESSSSPELKNLLEYILKHSSLKPDTSNNSNTSNKIVYSKSKVIEFNKQFYSYRFYPLRDYLGKKDISRHDVGSIFISKNISDDILTHKQDQLYSLFYAFIAYCIIELLLIITIIKITRQMSSQLKQQSNQLIKQTREIDLDKIKYKNLINTINNNYFFYTRSKTHFTFISSSIKQVLGYSNHIFLSNTLDYLSPKSQSILFQTKNDQTFLDHKRNTFEIDISNKNGRLQYLLINETIKNNLNKHQVDEIEGFAQDISQSRQEKMLLQLRCDILQMISDKMEQKNILNFLASGIESIIRDIHCSIMLVDQQSFKLVTGAAPSINKNLVSVLNGQKIKSAIGSCGIAAASSKRIIIADMKQDKSLKVINKIIAESHYQSCWSEPILSSKAMILATIDVYYDKKQKPNESDFAVIAVAVKLLSSLLNLK